VWAESQRWVSCSSPVIVSLVRFFSFSSFGAPFSFPFLLLTFSFSSASCLSFCSFSFFPFILFGLAVLGDLARSVFFFLSTIRRLRPLLPSPFCSPFFFWSLLAPTPQFCYDFALPTFPQDLRGPLSCLGRCFFSSSIDSSHKGNFWMGQKLFPSPPPCFLPTYPSTNPPFRLPLRLSFPLFGVSVPADARHNLALLFEPNPLFSSLPALYLPYWALQPISVLPQSPRLKIFPPVNLQHPRYPPSDPPIFLLKRAALFPIPSSRTFAYNILTDNSSLPRSCEKT